MPTDDPEILPDLLSDPEPIKPETDDGPQKSGQRTGGASTEEKG